jgi:hypothetical protein
MRDEEHPVFRSRPDRDETVVASTNSHDIPHDSIRFMSASRANGFWRLL